MTDTRVDELLDDDEASDEELAQAAELARALDREVVAEGALEALLPALEAAHLLRAQHAPEPSRQRLDELFEGIESSLPPRAARPAPSPAASLRALRGLWVALTGALAVAALALWFVARAPGSAEVATLPAPSLALLAAQAAAVDSQAAGVAAAAGGAPRMQELAGAMRPYRAQLLAQLEGEYAP